jgi:hypothetical protein
VRSVREPRRGAALKTESNSSSALWRKRGREDKGQIQGKEGNSYGPGVPREGNQASKQTSWTKGIEHNAYSVAQVMESMGNMQA